MVLEFARFNTPTVRIACDNKWLKFGNEISNIVLLCCITDNNNCHLSEILFNFVFVTLILKCVSLLSVNRLIYKCESRQIYRKINSEDKFKENKLPLSFRYQLYKFTNTLIV